MTDPQTPPPQASTASAPRLTVALVNYESWPDVVRLTALLQAEPEFLSGALEVIVVDNASQGPVPPQLAQRPSPGLRLVLRPENGGFAVGVNAAWRLARSPWILVLNPDVEIEKGLIGQVIERIEGYERRVAGPPGIVGFGLSNPDGTLQGSVGVFPSLPRTVREQFIPRARRKYQADWRIRTGPVDWVTGACMLLNTRMLAEVGGMDEDFFLYYEEVALSRTAQDRSWRVEFDDCLRVVHRHPLQSRPISPKLRVITRHSKLLYFLKHLPRWQFLGLSWIVSLEALVRGMGARVLGRSTQRRAWDTIGQINRRLRSGSIVRGAEVLRLAEAVAQARPGPGPGPAPEPPPAAADGPAGTDPIEAQRRVQRP